MAGGAVGLVGCSHEERSVAGINPLSVEDLKVVMRDLWSGHNVLIRDVALDNTMNNRKVLDYAEKAATANAKQIAKVFTPFYGGAVLYFTDQAVWHDQSMFRGYCCLK